MKAKLWYHAELEVVFFEDLSNANVWRRIYLIRTESNPVPEAISSDTIE